MIKDIIKLLQELDFSEYEAKAYLALLEKSPLTGYAVSLNSGVPRSKIYEVLGNLSARGDVIVSQDKTPLYAPLPPNELIARRKQKAEQTLGLAENALQSYVQSSDNRVNIWNISGRENILNRIKEAMKGAKQRILMVLWQDDADELRESLRQQSERGVEIIIMSYGDLKDYEFAEICRHDLSDEVATEQGGRWILFSMDDEEVVAGIVSLGSESRAAWSSHPALVIPMTEFIIHDWYIMLIMQEFRPVIEEKFGHHLIKLREKFGIKGQKAKTFM